MKSEMKTSVEDQHPWVVSYIAYMKKRMERRIRILNMLGIERIRGDTIVRSSMDLVTSLVILSNQSRNSL